jgi:hypothetical protein
MAVIAASSLRRAGQGAGRSAALASTAHDFTSIVALLAVSGLAELFLQRVVYRVGVHIPRDGAFLQAYRAATAGGDFAYRMTAVLLALAVPLAALWLFQRRSQFAAVCLVGLAAVNLAAWPFGVEAAAAVGPFVFIAGVIWLAATALRSAGAPLSAAIVAAVVALALAQYRTGMTAIGEGPGNVGLLQTAAEVSLLACAAFAALAAGAGGASRKAASIAVLVTALLFASYAREPSTVAIVSLWATGVTMSLPGLLYVGGFGAVVYAALSWVGRPDSRHLALALALLCVAGLQPQALHHGLTAFLGVALLTATARDLAPVQPHREVTYASES